MRLAPLVKGGCRNFATGGLAGSILNSQSFRQNLAVLPPSFNKDGFYSTEKTLSVKAKESKNDFAAAFRDLCGIFKKGGLKAAYNKINTIIRDITPEDDEMTEMSREDFFPSNIKLVYVILAVIWIISLVSGFLN